MRRFVIRPALALLVALVLGVPALVLWALGTERGSAWVLAQVPGLRTEQLAGTLLGGLRASRVELMLPGTTPGTLVLREFASGALRLAPASGPRWLRIDLDELHATRLDLTLPATAGPAQPPASLALPVEVVVQTLRIDALHLPALGERPLRDVSARVHLGDERGDVHRVEQLAAAWQAFRADGEAQIAVAAPFALQARLRATRPELEAEVRAGGPLAAPELSAHLSGRVAGVHAAPALDAKASLRPFAPWPLGALEATTRGLDLAAIDAALPATSLDGTAAVRSTAADRPAEIAVEITNRGAGRVDEGRLPLRGLRFELRARPDDPRTLDLRTFDAELGNAQAGAGKVTGHGAWTPARWNIEAALAAIEPARLDARAQVLNLAGTVELIGNGFGSAGLAQARIDARAELSGRFDARGAARDARLRLDAGVDGAGIDLRRAEASSGGARAVLAGTLRRPAGDGLWRARGTAELARFDPLPWWPGGDDSPWRKGPHRVSASATFDLAWPDAARTLSPRKRLAALRGNASVVVADSLLAGVPLAGRARLRSDGGPAALDVTLDSDRNHLHAQGRVDLAGDGSADQWDATLAAPALARLAPLSRLIAPGLAAPAGAVDANVRVGGRWPALRSQGEFDIAALRSGELSIGRAQGRWQLAPSDDAPLALQASIAQGVLGTRGVESAELQVEGTARAHRITLAAESKALPPSWVDEVQTLASGSTAAPPKRSVARFEAQGGLFDEGHTTRAGWRGRIARIELGSDTGRRWLASSDFDASLRWAGAPLRVEVDPGRAELLGTTLRWSRVAWQAGDEGAARIDARAELEPLTVAPMLTRVQPDFGWGGDLTVGARLELRSTPAFSADIVIERKQGDLTVTDETGTTALELTDLRLGLNVADGVWSFTQGLAGKTLGVAAGAVVARTSPQVAWPPADTPITGVLEIQVANLGTWGRWVPAGWRLGGALRVSASIGGRFGAPEYTGEVRGNGITVRNFVEGVAIGDGEVAITLQGARAQIDHISARAGDGSVRLEGVATLGEVPQADLRLVAERFQLLGRVDRRIVASGDARLVLDRDALALDGRLRIDQGLVDFTRGDAPALSGDVTVVRAEGAAPRTATAAPARRIGPALPQPKIDIRVDLGEQLRLRGRGLDTALRGDLRITAPSGRLAVNGTVRAEDGTYAAYGQKLAIDRGALTFNGPVENPRLDIEATRPNIDLRVGVAVTGTAIAPRVRLFSEPELPEIDKLSWLVLGRASEGLGSADTALLQRAALALLAGEGEGFTGQLFAAIGLDQLSVRQSEGEVRETVVSLGKQLSKRWYVGYERSLNATTGTWQLVYRIARRFTLRAQSGLDNSLDAIWMWRWQ